MKLTPKQRQKIYNISHKILVFFEKMFSLLTKLYEKPVERRKRELLKYGKEMTEEDIREYRYQLTLIWTVGAFFVILFLLHIGGKLIEI